MTDFGYICCIGLSLVAFVLSFGVVIWLVYSGYYRRKSFDSLTFKIVEIKSIKQLRICEVELYKYTQKYNNKYDHEFLKSAITKKEKDLNKNI